MKYRLNKEREREREHFRLSNFEPIQTMIQMEHLRQQHSLVVKLNGLFKNRKRKRFQLKIEPKP